VFSSKLGLNKPRRFFVHMRQKYVSDAASGTNTPRYFSLRWTDGATGTDDEDEEDSKSTVRSLSGRMRIVAGFINVVTS
jgi:hypothetical protein